MEWLALTLTKGFDLLLVVLGFSLIIVLHELGHFVAARWAGIRVMAFAVGFGPALVSFRNGMGWRRGSSEPEYLKLSSTTSDWARQRGLISPTEYRLNFLPFGGYVKMLGQDDSNPAAVSDEPDSYQRCVPWKRMIVISAGVVVNMIVAALLFIVVFMIGLKTEPAMIGYVEPDSPAAVTMATNAAALAVSEPGLRSGDRIASINGRRPNSFNDLVLASVMTRKGHSLSLLVEREGVNGALNFQIVPVINPATKMLMVGVGPASSITLPKAANAEEAGEFSKRIARLGLSGVAPGMRLLEVNGEPVATPYALDEAARRSEGKPFDAVLADDAGTRVSLVIQPRPEYKVEHFKLGENFSGTDSLLGLLPVMMVADVHKQGQLSGLKPGDVFSRLGGVEWPSVVDGIAQIRSRAGKTIPVSVIRQDSLGAVEIDLGNVAVSGKGTVGFLPGDTADSDTLIAGWPSLPRSNPYADDRAVPPLPSGASLGIVKGSRVVKVDGNPVVNLGEVREILRAKALRTAEASGFEVALTVQLPTGTSTGAPIETMTWKLSPDDARDLANLFWVSTLAGGDFAPEQFYLKAATPAEAMNMGLSETRRVMMTTYVTFARLFQGSVKVEHLKGPVGIAHVGTLIAGRGFVWLMFFMALISVNLAVINFLPLPIADGGQFLFLLYEQIVGRPIPIPVQNAVALVGIVLLVSVFLLVTFNDISNLVRQFVG